MRLRCLNLEELWQGSVELFMNGNSLFLTPLLHYAPFEEQLREQL